MKNVTLIIILSFFFLKVSAQETYYKLYSEGLSLMAKGDEEPLVSSPAKKENYEKALETLDEALNLSKDELGPDVPFIDGYLARGKARRKYALCSDNPKVWFQSALEDFETLRLMHSKLKGNRTLKSPELELETAICYAFLEDYDQCSQHLKLAEDFGCTDIGQLDYYEGLVKMEKKLVDEAILKFTSAQIYRSQDPAIFFGLGKCHAKKRGYRLAAANFEEAIGLNYPQIDSAYTALAHAQENLYKEGNAEYLDKAISNYQKAIQRRADNGFPYYRLGACFSIKERYSEAIWHFEKAVELGFKSTLVYQEMARAKMATEEYEEALFAFQEILNTNPNSTIKASTLLNKGYCELMLKRYELSEESLKDALKGGSFEDAYIYFLLAKVNYERAITADNPLQSYEESKNYIKKALKKMPYNEEYKAFDQQLDDVIKEIRQFEALRIEFLEQQEDLQVTERDYTIKAQIYSFSKVDISLEREGAKSIALDPVSYQNRNVYSFEKNVSLILGENTFILTAKNQGGSIQQSIIIKYMPEQPSIYAVLIGVNEYDGMEDLKFPDDDVQNMRFYLGTKKAKKIQYLTNNRPNKTAVMEAFKSMANQVGEKDLLWFYFSGHGEQGKLLPKDVSYEDSTKIALKDIAEILDNCPARFKVVMIDACYSGAFLETQAKDTDPAVAKNLTKFYNLLSQSKDGKALLLSSMPNEKSYEKMDINGSVFTHYFLEGLQSGVADINEDKVITVEEAFQYAQTKTRQRTEGQQNPVIVGEYDPYLPLEVLEE